MYQTKIVYLLLLVCYELVKCEDVQTESIDANLNCGQYANDLDIIATFPFTVNLNPQKQGPGISTAILDSTNTLVIMIQLRQAGGTVPESVFCLKHLQSLDIMDMVFVNGIVPDALSNLPLLFSLSIKNSPISKMTDKVTSLHKLESLTLDSCSLTHMPNLHGMSKLYTVTLPNNQLSELHGLMNPYQLFLYKNLFTEIPTQTEPDTLTRIYMNYNPVKDLSTITTYSNLTELRLSNTKVSVIPSTIDELENLNFIDLSFTQITEIPNTILNLAKLQYLVIQNNAFSAQEVDKIKTEFSTQRPNVNLLI